METVTLNYHEKRNFIRMKVNSPVDVSTDGDSLHGTCINLSGGGMLIALDKTLEPGGLIEVTISSNHGHNPMLRALAQVNRVTTGQVPLDRPYYFDSANTDEQPVEENRYIIGLEFKTLIEARSAGEG